MTFNGRALLIDRNRHQIRPCLRRAKRGHLIGEGLAEHVLVEGAREVGVDDLAVVQRLAHHAAHELEKVQVVGAAGLVVLHDAVGVGLEGGVAHRDEQ
jgi:hypothetical protein